MDKLDEMTKYIYNLTYPILIIRGTKGLPKKEYLKTYAVELYSLLMGEYDLKLIRNIIPNLEELILDYDLSYEDDKALFIGWGNSLIIVTSFFENYLKTHSESFEEDYMYYIWNDIAIFETLIFQNQLLHLIDYQINQLSTELSPSELARIRDEIRLDLEEYYNVRVYAYGEYREYFEIGKEILGLKELYATIKEKLESIEYSINAKFQEKTSQYQTLLAILFGVFGAAQVAVQLYPSIELAAASIAAMLLASATLYLALREKAKLYKNTKHILW